MTFQPIYKISLFLVDLSILIFKTDQGIKNLSASRAGQLAGENPDYAIEDLYNAIAKGDFPSWTLHIQVMTLAEAESYKHNPFDVTKVNRTHFLNS